MWFVKLKRILLKISGEALMGKSNYGIDVSTINKITNEIKKSIDDIAGAENNKKTPI